MYKRLRPWFLLLILLTMTAPAIYGQQIRLGIDTQGTLPISQGGTSRTTVCPIGGLMQSDGSVYGCVTLSFPNFTGTADPSQLPSTIAYEDEANTFSLTQSFSIVKFGDITCQSAAGTTNCRDNSIGTGNTLLNIQPGDNDSGLDPVFCVGPQSDCTSTQDFQFTANGTFRLTDTGILITPTTVTMPSTGEFEWGSSGVSTPDVQLARVGTEALGVSLPSSPSTRADLEVRNLIPSLVEFTESAGDPTCIAGSYNIKGNSTTGVLRGCENGTLFSLNSSSSAYSTIEDEDTPLTQRTALNFEGSGVTCADDTTKTTCTIPGGGGGSTNYRTAIASIPGTCTTNDLWFNNDLGSSYTAYCSSTNTWSYYWQNEGATLPPSSGWTWDNQESGDTVAFTGGFMSLAIIRTGVGEHTFQYRTAPSAPYTIDYLFEHDFSGLNAAAGGGRDANTGVYFSDSTGKFIYFGAGVFNNSAGVVVAKWNSTGSHNSDYFSDFDNTGGALYDFWSSGKFRFRIEDDNTNLKFYFSTTGAAADWVQFGTSVSRTDFLTSGPTRYGIGGYKGDGTIRIKLVSIKEN